MNKAGFTFGHRWALAVSSGMAALVVASVSPAMAQCAPDAAQGTGSPRCFAADNDGSRTTPSAVAMAVAMADPNQPDRFYADGLYVSGGRTVEGDLVFGNGADTFIATNDVTGVTGMIDGGGGQDYFIHERSTSGSVVLNPPDLINFELQGVRALGKDTIVTIDAVDPVDIDVVLSGNGNIVNDAVFNGVVRTYPYPVAGDANASLPLASFTNRGALRQGFYGPTGSFVNTGTIDSGNYAVAVAITGTPDLVFANSGRISNTSSLAAVNLATYPGAIAAVNSGSITGGLSAQANSDFPAAGAPRANLAIALANSGTIVTNAGLGVATRAVSLNLSDPQGAGGTIMLNNSGTIDAAEIGGTAAFLGSSYSFATFGRGSASITVNNSGVIRADGGGAEQLDTDRASRFTQIATALAVSAASGTLDIANEASGLIEASGSRSVGLIAFDIGLNLTNAGTIRGGDGTILADNSSQVGTIRSTYLAGAIQAVGDADDHIVNSGTIIGSVALGNGNDTIENRGTIRGNVFLGAGNDAFLEQAGATLIGVADGGAGTDSLVIDATGGGTIDSGRFINFERLTQIGTGNVAYSGAFGFATIDVLGGGRLIGLAGSTITAPSIFVGSNATFGSAGVVNGNIAVNGTLSPGASPGTMTVNGTVALANGSTSLFEITPTVSDKLVVNGTLSIAQGATLQLAATGVGKPGATIDLIAASGGITGSYTNIVKPASLFGFLVQDATRIRLAGEFLNDPGFSAPVRRTIDYVNGVLASGRASAALIAAAPSLVSTSGASNPGLFGRLTPEAYASAQQITVGNGLTLAEIGRGADFAAHRTPGAFTFASVLGGTATLEADASSGTALARTNGYGFLGGIGFGSPAWSLGAFGGYLNTRQTLAGLATRTRVDGTIAGVHGRFASGGVGIKAMVAYDGGDADTRRAVPDGSVDGNYRLRGWTADASIDYALAMAGDWMVRPRLGATVIRATRSATTEAGTSAFSLSVARRAETAVFVDGGLTFSGAATVSAVRIMPYLSLGVRYQTQGRTPVALAGLDGGSVSLLAEGAPRAPVLATATFGASVALAPRLALFGAMTGESGDADHRAGGRAGLRLAF